MDFQKGSWPYVTNALNMRCSSHVYNSLLFCISLFIPWASYTLVTVLLKQATEQLQMFLCLTILESRFSNLKPHRFLFFICKAKMVGLDLSCFSLCRSLETVRAWCLINGREGQGETNVPTQSFISTVLVTFIMTQFISGNTKGQNKWVLSRESVFLLQQLWMCLHTRQMNQGSFFSISPSLCKNLWRLNMTSLL